MLSHFARKNAQFIARFYSFDYETSHCDVSVAQGDANEVSVIPFLQITVCVTLSGAERYRFRLRLAASSSAQSNLAEAE